MADPTAPYLWGAQRRIEARVGEVLGPATQGKRTDLTSTHASKSPLVDWERRDFRQIADLVRRELLREMGEKRGKPSTLTGLGIDWTQSSRWQRVADLVHCVTALRNDGGRRA